VSTEVKIAVRVCVCVLCVCVCVFVCLPCILAKVDAYDLCAQADTNSTCAYV
jgi:hypothetical protein